jgi:hypothetical protein
MVGDSGKSVAQQERSLSLKADSLWAQYVRDPLRHPYIPNCSWAGYRYGEQPIPRFPVVANVKTLGAVGDGSADDTDAFKASLDQAIKAGGGTILIPAGIYRLTERLQFNSSRIVLRGEGQGKSILRFDKSLGDLIENAMWWSWRGGLIWIGPNLDSLVKSHFLASESIPSEVEGS